ncbi:lipopolysaccharide biosynthesis protein [Candidatus Latescibacterota bacterium]
MFAHLSRLLRHSVVYGMSETISRGTGFVLIFIYARLLTDSDIGIRTLVYGASSFVTLFYTLGLDNAFLRYFMDKENEHLKDRVLSTAFLFTVCAGTCFFMSAFFFSETFSSIIVRNESYSYIIRLIFTVMLLDTAVIYPMLILRAERRLAYYSLVSLSRFVLFISLNLILVWWLDRGLKGIFEANLVTVAIIVMLLSPVMKEYFTGRLSLKLLKRMLLFGIPTIFTMLFMRVIDISDRYLVEHFVDKAAVGRYHVAYMLGMVGIMVFVNSFRTAWHPFFLSLKDSPEAGKLFARVATYYAVFICMVYLGIILFRQEIFQFYAPQHPVGLSDIIPFVSLAYLLYGFYIIMLAGIFIREKTKFLPLAPMAGALLNVGFNIFLIPRYGIIGAAITTVIAYCTMVFILFAISRKVYRVSYEYGRLGFVLLMTALLIGIEALFDPGSNVMRYTMKISILFVPPLVYWYSGFLRVEERKKVVQMINSLLLKFQSG